MAPESYRAAGVDVAAADAWLAGLGRHLSAIGGFGGLFPLGPHISGMTDPCLVAATDGVGTKLLVARAANDFSTVGIDCVAMVVNDLICSGARPLFFLDYLAVGKFDAAEADAVLRGLRHGCEQTGCDLIGGETAEMPGLLQPGDFDVCGFGVGVVAREKVIDGSTIAPGDIVIGLPSSGIHSNGLSLARRALPGYGSDSALAHTLLTPTYIYVREMLKLVEKVPVRGIAHITGGGLPGNLSRILPKQTDARLDPATWKCPAIFDTIAERGKITPAEMFHTFNMGIGMGLVVAASDADATLDSLRAKEARVIGEITEGAGNVEIQGVTL